MTTDTIYAAFYEGMWISIADHTSVCFRFDIMHSSPNLFGSLATMLITFIRQFEIDPRLLEVLVGFEGVILALAIPLSYQVIANISERYNSETITGLFTRRFVVRWFSLVLIIAISFTVILTLMCSNYCNSLIWRLLVILSVGIFFLVVIMLFGFLRVLTQYSSNTEAVFEEHLKNAEKFLE